MAQMVKMVKMSDIAEELRPVLVDMIETLGFTKEQGEKFAEGYLKDAAKLPMLDKLHALESIEQQCMTAGLEAAGISDDELFQNYQDQPDKPEEGGQ